VSEKTIKVVLIGYGHIGKRHAAVIMASNYFELIALVDTHHEKRPENLPETVGFFVTLNDFLSSENNARLAIIATPNGLHGQQIKKCLNHGLDVVAEKPIVLSSTELNKLHQMAIDAGLHLFPVVQNRYAKIALWLKQVLYKEFLGKVYIIQVNCLWNRDERYYQPGSWHGDLQLDGGSLYTQFLHFIDMLYWLFGKPTVKSATLLDFNHQTLSSFEDSGLVQFEFTNGIAKDALAAMTFSTAAWGKNAESSLTILGENGTIKIGGQYMEKLQYAIGNGLENEAVLQTELSKDAYKEKYGAAGGHYQFWDQMEKFYSGLPHALPTVQEATEVIEIIEQIYQHR